MRSLHLRALGVLALAAFVAGCVAGGDEQVGQDEDELLKKTASTSRWSYRGVMPELESPELVVSLAGHTVRVSGYVPRERAASLPFYAIGEPDPRGGDRAFVSVVYPIATVKQGAITTSGLPARNPEPGRYAVCGGGNFWASNAIGSFGGFPFIEYVCDHTDADGRVRSGIAMHGPITSLSADGASYWFVERGPVSHACNRMLGEHVLELAHLIGFDHGRRGTPVTVVAGVDTWHGRAVDVDYPATDFARPDHAVVFPTWQAVTLDASGSTRLAFPQWACETSRCAKMPPNRFDAESGGLAYGAVECPDGLERRAAGAGAICVSPETGEALGPFTRAMTDACSGAFCASARWPAQDASRLWGDRRCPAGSRFDAITSYCVEGRDAFGPFPKPVVDACVAATGSDACTSPRWDRFLLAHLLGRL